ncbi:MAG: hypothetical protein QXV01_12805 [Candidatus Bathyarchaeia archaeon]
MKLSLRELRGLSIVALGGQIKKADESTFLVRSQSDPSSHHKVKWNDDGWVCDCADYAKRGSLASIYMP